MASLGYLSSEQTSIMIPVADDRYVVVGTQPLLFHSDLSFDVLADKSKSKAEAILVEKDNSEDDQSSVREDGDPDEEFDEDESAELGEEAAQ